MKKLFLLSCAFVLLSSCAALKQAKDTQTALHDLSVQIKDAQDVKQSSVEFKEDCVITKVEFSTDSFGYYTHCPKTSVHLKKEVLEKAYPLMK